MTKYKFPLRIAEDKKVILTQGFKSQELIDEYKKNGYNIQFHDAIDVATGTLKDTHGTPLVCPFPKAECIYFDDSGATGTQKADRVQIKYVDGDTEYIMGGLHFSKMLYQQNYVFGETIAWLGNSGFVLPAPTKDSPLNGSHLHLTLRVNGVIVDPLLYFDINNPFRGEDTGDAFDVNELTPIGTIKLPPASETIANFAYSQESWKKAILFTLAKWLQSLGY